jgi:cell division protein FtsB
MALSNEELEAKIDFLTKVVNELQIAVQHNLASKMQLRQLTLLKQKDIDDLKNRVTDLEAEVNLLKLR